MTTVIVQPLVNVVDVTEDAVNVTVQPTQVSVVLDPGSLYDEFIALNDAPHSYTGQTLKIVRVNAGETGLEFATSPAGESNTASNVGAGGVGTYKQKVGVDLQFKNVNAGSSKVTVTDDPANSEVDVDVSESNLTLDNLGGTLAISKGGTSATSFSVSELIRLKSDGSKLESSGKLAPTGDIVGTTDTQDISNKNITPLKLIAPAGGVVRIYDTDGVTVIAEFSKDAVRFLGQVEPL